MKRPYSLKSKLLALLACLVALSALLAFGPSIFSVYQGGTGAASFTAHGVLIGEGTSAIAATGTGSSGQVLTSNGSSSDPTFQPASGGGGATTLCKHTGLTDTITAAGNFATTCSISANTTVFGSRFDVYAVGKEVIVSGDNHQYGLNTGEPSSIGDVGHSALVGTYVWSAHWVLTLSYDGSITAIQSGGDALSGADCAVWQRNGGGSSGTIFPCNGDIVGWTPSNSHTFQITATGFVSGSSSTLTEFWVTQTDP